MSKNSKSSQWSVLSTFAVFLLIGSNLASSFILWAKIKKSGKHVSHPQTFCIPAE